MIWVKNDFNIISKIMSFEKKPDIKGRPLKASKEMPIDIEIEGVFFIIFPMCRISWYEEFIIMIPAVINIIDLNIAWVIIWK